MRTVIPILGAVLAVSAVFASPVRQAHGMEYGSYLSAPAQENSMLRDGLDADEMVGSEVVSVSGQRLGAITDLLVSPDGEIRLAAVDVGQGTGEGSRHVAIEIGRLKRTETGALAFTIDLNPEQLATLPEYRLMEDHWQPVQ
jgi:hypothetical protein